MTFFPKAFFGPYKPWNFIQVFFENFIQFKPEDIFIQESEMLRKVRDTIDKLGIEAAKDMILKAPSPKLWRILGEAAMAALKLGTQFVNYYKIT